MFGPGAVDVQAHRPAHHHVGKSLGVGLGCIDGADVLALAQDGHLVGDVHHLVELVSDDDDGLAVGLHIAQDGEELVGLLGGENRGGLIQNEDVGAPVEDLDDLHRLLLGDRHIIDLLARVDIEAILFADGLDIPGHRFPVQLTLPLQTQDDVLRGRQNIHQLKVLVDHTDAQTEGVLGGADGYRLAVHLNLAAVGEIDAGEHIHQRGLAAAVLPQQGQDLAPFHIQADGVVGHHLTEGFGDVFQSYGRSFFQIPHLNRRSKLHILRPFRGGTGSLIALLLLSPQSPDGFAGAPLPEQAPYPSPVSRGNGLPHCAAPPLPTKPRWLRGGPIA